MRYIGVIFISISYYMAWEYLWGVHWHEITYLPLFIGYACMLKALFTSPGVIKSKIIPQEEVSKHQQKFIDTFTKHGFLKPIHAHYSSNTERMVLDFDHYCHWLGNDIGIYNYRYFIQFVFWTFLNCLFVFCDTFNTITGCVLRHDYWSCTVVINHKIIVIGLFFITFIIGAMSLALLQDIYVTFNTGWGIVDRKRNKPKMTDNNMWNVYFGSNKKSFLYWILPLNNKMAIKYRFRNHQRKCGEILEKQGLKVDYKY